MRSILDQTVLPESKEGQIAELQQLLEAAAATLSGPNGSRRLELSEPLYNLLRRIITDLAAGKPVSLLVGSLPLTSQEAADILGVSRQYLTRLLDEGKIPFHQVGVHRRIYMRDVLEFRRERDRLRREALDQLARESEAAGAYDDF